MSPTLRHPQLDAVLEALPIGIALFDGDERLVLSNRLFASLVDLPPPGLRTGLPLETVLRIGLDAGQQGRPGPDSPDPNSPDPNSPGLVDLARIRAQPGVRLPRALGGRTFDLQTAALNDGGLLICAVETTKLVTAQEEADRAVTRVATALATMRTGLATFAADRTLLLHNPCFAEMLGLPPDQLREGLPFADMLALMRASHEYAGAEGAEFLAAETALDRTRRWVGQRLRPNGQVIDIASEPLPDGGWTTTVADVTPLAQAEHESTRRAFMLDSILENIPHGVCVYGPGPDRRVTMFNRAYVEIMEGAPLTVGDDLATVIRRRAQAGEYGPGQPVAVFAEQMAHDIGRPQLRRRQRPNGTTMDVRTAPLPDGGHISVVTDVTSLTQAESELLRRAAEMDVMLANIRHGIILYDVEHRLVASNREASELLDLPASVLTPGRAFADILEDLRSFGEFGEGEDARISAAALVGFDRARSRLYRRRTRTGRVIEVRSDPAAGGGFVLTYSDVTASENAQEELRRAKEAAEAANQAKSRFLATMSHELRTPLNAVIGFSEALLRDMEGADPGRAAEFATAINDSGRQLLGLINTILDVARIEAGRFEMSSDRVDLARLVQTCARHVEPAALASELNLRVELPASLPAARADERRLRQVLNNLLSNAVKFTPAGSVTISATVVPEGELLVRVADTGIGIAEADLDRVFEPFTQLDATLARRFQGAGLGLYVSRSLVQAHGGQLRLRSKVGVGTTAEIALPMSRLIWDDAVVNKDVA